MRLQSLLGGSISLAALLLLVSASPVGDATEPEIAVVASFPEDNPFGHVVNGERNKINLLVENHSDRNVTLKQVTGSFHQVETNALVKNTSTLAYDIYLIEGGKITLPYTFYSEFKPGDIKLNLWLDHSVDDETYRVTAYDSIVTVVEPEVSFFDFKLLSTYLVVAGLFGSLMYFAYLTFVPQQKKSRSKPRVPDVSSPVGTVTATGAGGYQEEWIPEHHLPKSKTGRKKGGAVSSGDELSGPEATTETRKRKGKK